MPKVDLAKLGIFAVLLVFLLGSSWVLADILQNQAIAAPYVQFYTGNFQLRSYRKATHPKFGSSPDREIFSAVSVPNCTAVIPDQIYRFVEGIDSCLQPMTDDEIEQMLKDPFATGILSKGTFPENVDALAAAIADSQLNLESANYFLGEGSQIPTTIASREEPRNLRYVLTWGTSRTSNADILVSTAAGGNSSFLQVIAWDAQAKKYNFYELREQVGEQPGTSTKVWTWAGDSGMARAKPTMGVGCFDCHHNGVVIMKELARPWNNWHSERGGISPLVVPLRVTQETFFQNLQGAEVLEQVIRSGFINYHNNWLRDRYKRQAGVINLSDVNQMLRHLTTNTTINLASTNIESNGANTSPANRPVNGIPNDFFVWDSALKTSLGLNYNIPLITFERQEYDNYLNTHHFQLVQSDFTKPDDSPLYEQDGSTYFSFFVPVPAAEDLYMLTRMRSAKILTDKFIAAVLMVDFKNPVFSEKRSSLQQYAEQVTTGTIINGISSVPNDFAEKVRVAAANQPPCDPTNLDQCTAEQEFLQTWELPDNQWKSFVQEQIQAYLDELNTLSPREQLAQLMESSVKHREQFQSWPTISNLNEFSLLLPQSDLSH
ncbi:MAG: hypothetical protein F6J98_16515 [Moorea sp. SIO4G2]|nr:hypothetical protein [Moorena sp. SIO4G2]